MNFGAKGFSSKYGVLKATAIPRSHLYNHYGPKLLKNANSKATRFPDHTQKFLKNAHSPAKQKG